MAATASSTSMPLAPMTTRCHLFLNAQALEASIYGNGVKRRNVTPISCTSPPVPDCLPKCLHEKACPISWNTFTIKSPKYNKGKFAGFRIIDDPVERSCIRPATDHNPAPTIPSQRRRPYQVNTLPTSPTQRSRTRSGSNMGMRMERKLMSNPFTSRWMRFWYRRKSVSASMVRLP